MSSKYPTPENKYKSKTYDRHDLVMMDGKLAELRALAKKAGESVNAYVLRAVEDRSGLKLVLDREPPNVKKGRERRLNRTEGDSVKTTASNAPP